MARPRLAHRLDVVTVVDGDGTVRFVNTAAERAFGLPVDRLIGTRFTEHVHDQDLPALDRAVAVALAGQDDEWSAAYRIRRGDGGQRMLDATATVMRDDCGGVLHIITARDVSEARQRTDTLTGVADRARVTRRLDRALRSGDTREHKVACLAVGLDAFATLNDALGHAAGDRVLIETAARLVDLSGDEHCVGRLGGDTFAVVLPEIEDGQEADTLAALIVADCEGPIRVGGREVVVTASVGIAVAHPSDPVAAEELVQRANAAMRVAKSRGGQTVVRFDAAPTWPGFTPDARLEIEHALRGAARRGELSLVYQPVCDVRTGAVDGAEALLRWRHPDLGVIPPDVFIPIAEATGVIRSIGRWVLDEACRQAAAWHRGNLTGAPLTVAVNLSARQLLQEDLREQVVAAIDASGIDPAHLIFEITESTAMEQVDPKAVAEALGELKRLGVRLAMDDFGTGFSSLDRLRRLPIDVLKIDRSFVASMMRSEGDRAIVNAVVTLAHAVGATVTAEGVEGADQMDELRVMGCDLAQGYALARPLSPEQFAATVCNGGLSATEARAPSL